MQPARWVWAVLAAVMLWLSPSRAHADQPPTREHSKEALALLPADVLDRLPPLITSFLTPADWVYLKQACPQPAPKQVLDCLGAEPVSQELGVRAGIGVMNTILASMDAEIPRRLVRKDYLALSDTCDKPGDAWAECAFAQGLESPACKEPEVALATCLVGDERVVQLFVDIQKEKKEIFGKELYVQLAGLLSTLDVESVKALKQHCPQTELGAVISCMEQAPVVSAILNRFLMVSAAVVDKADQEIQAAGGPALDKKVYTIKVLGVLIALPFRSIERLSNACELAHPELAKLDSAAEVDQSLACIVGESETDPVANPAFITKDKLKSWIEIGRTKVIDKLRVKDKESQSKSLSRMLTVLGIVALLGPFGIFLYAALVVRRRYPDKGPIVWKSSAIAAGTFVGTMGVLALTLAIVRAGQGAVATDATSPTIRVANGAFDVLEQDRWLDGFSQLSRTRLDFLKEPLRVVVEDTGGAKEEAYTGFLGNLASHWANLVEEPEVKRFAKNVTMLASHAKTFKSAIEMYKTIQWLLTILPMLLSILTVVLYLVPMKGTLKDIVTMPGRVAARADGATDAEVTRRAKLLVLSELKLIGPYLAVVLVFLPIVGMFLGAVMRPLLEMVILEALLTVFYIIFNEASGFVIYASFGSTILLLAITIAVYIVAMGTFLGTVRNILRSRFYFGQKLGQYKKFASWGLGAILLVMVIPVVHSYAANLIFRGTKENLDIMKLSGGQMLTVPLLSLLLFPIVFWAARGFKALQYIKKFPVKLELATAATSLPQPMIEAPPVSQQAPFSYQPVSQQAPASYQPPSQQAPVSQQPISSHALQLQQAQAQGAALGICWHCRQPISPQWRQCMACNAKLVS